MKIKIADITPKPFFSNPASEIFMPFCMSPSHNLTTNHNNKNYLQNLFNLMIEIFINISQHLSSRVRQFWIMKVCKFNNIFTSNSDYTRFTLSYKLKQEHHLDISPSILIFSVIFTTTITPQPSFYLILGSLEWHKFHANSQCWHHF